MHRSAGGILACILSAAAAAQQAPALTPLRIVTFDGGWNLPLWAAQRQGFFEANGVAVQTSYTPNSGFLVTSLLDGRFDIALTLIDNLVAYQEGQGEAQTPTTRTCSHSWVATAACCQSSPRPGSAALPTSRARHSRCMR